MFKRIVYLSQDFRSFWAAPTKRYIWESVLRKQGVEGVEVVCFSSTTAECQAWRAGFFRCVSYAALDEGWFLALPEQLCVIQESLFLSTSVQEGVGNQASDIAMGVTIGPSSIANAKIHRGQAENLRLSGIKSLPAGQWVDHYYYPGYFFCGQATLQQFLQAAGSRAWEPQAFCSYQARLAPQGMKAILLSGERTSEGVFCQSSPSLAAWQSFVARPFRPCLFLDRDGVIIHDTGYPHRVDELVVNEEVIPLIQWAKDQGFWVVVLTNQAGISKGIFSEEAFQEVTAYLQGWLSQHGAQPDAWFHCPYHPEGKVAPYNQHCLERKPYPGMVLKAMRHFPIRLEKSLMVGDRKSDVLAVGALQNYLVKGIYALDGVDVPIFSDLSSLLVFLKAKQSSLS